LNLQRNVCPFVFKVTRHKLFLIDFELLNMGAILSFEMMGTFYPAIMAHFPEDSNPD
jgi:hypothetical protein